MNTAKKRVVAVTNEVLLIDDDFIKSRIFTVRGAQVMLDRDLAALYGVTTKRLNEQVKRNMARFPTSFRFSLSKEEMEELVANCDRLRSMKHSSVPMSAFTEHGLIMLASVLKSDVAISVSIRITNAFVAMRKALASVAPILSRLDVVERRQIADQLRVCESTVQMELFSWDKLQPVHLPKQGEFTAVELFAGAGGLSIGLERAGIHAVIANEIMPDFAATFAENWLDAKAINEDSSLEAA